MSDGGLPAWRESVRRESFWLGPGPGDPDDRNGARDTPIRSATEPARVLIVEDEGLIALEMALTLQSAGFEVVGSKRTGLAALNLLALEAVDLVLLDISLPGDLDGIETMRRIQALRPGLPVLFVTGQADPATRSRAEATNPAGYLLKPLSPEQLTQAVRDVLEQP